MYELLQNELQNHRKFWDYYGHSSVNDILEDEYGAEQFIKEYFEAGAKLYAVKGWPLSENRYEDTRYVHTVNTFFIGVYLQRIIDENIEIKTENTKSNYPFSYIWFLTCLAHDFGVALERHIKIDRDVFKEEDAKRYIRDDKKCYRFFSRSKWYERYYNKFKIKVLHPYLCTWPGAVVCHALVQA